MNIKVKNISGDIYLSYKYLNEIGVSFKTTEKWRKQGVSIFKDGKYSFVKFEDIPTTTRKKLPSKEFLLQQLVCDKKESEVKSYVDILREAQTNDSPKYRAYYKDNFNLNNDDALEASRKRAVWGKLIELHNNALTARGVLPKGVLELLFTAYTQLYNGKYTSKHAFIPTIKACKSAGFDAVVVDKRKFSKGNNRQMSELHYYFVNGVLSIGKAYSAPQIRQKITPMCEEANIRVPSLSWIKDYITKTNKHNENNTRYGADYTKKQIPFASMQAAKHANKQWQVDGFTLGFYCKTDDNTINKLIVVVVKDAYSRKIVGYSIARSENRLSILEAYQDAINKTGGIAYEIVTDNHSFNRTQEGENFISEAQKIGTVFTVSSNPQYKSIIERGFKALDQYFKPHANYKGQGVKSREKNAHTSPELLLEYLKADKILSEDEVKLIVISTIKEFNNTPLKATKKSPEQMYNESEKPMWYELDMYDQARLFINKATYKIIRGQITMIIAGTKYEYQLSAEHYERYNGKKVSVRYESTDLIYVFDAKTDRSICTIKQKPKIHGAKADQTEADILLLNKQAGRVKGIKEQSRKKSESLAEKALKLNPDAIEILHHYTTPKDVLQEAETDYEIRQEAERRGIDLSRVTTVPKVTEITNPTYLGKKETRKERSPFMPKNHTIRILEPNYNTDDE